MLEETQITLRFFQIIGKQSGLTLFTTHAFSALGALDKFALSQNFQNWHLMNEYFRLPNDYEIIDHKILV